MKKNFLILFSLVFLSYSYAQVQQTPKNELKPEEYNFTTFYKTTKATDLSMWSKWNTAKDTRHPEYGVLPKNAPCTDCVEVYTKRTPDKRYFKDTKDTTKYYIQNALGDLNMKEGDHWVTIDHKLKPVNNYYYTTTKYREPLSINVQQNEIALHTVHGKIQFNNWQLFFRKDNVDTFGATANWSNYTIGEDGMYVTNIFNGIDAEFIVYRGAVKTNFIIKEHLYYEYDALVFKDTFTGNSPIDIAFENNEKDVKTGFGTIKLFLNDKDALTINEAIGYVRSENRDGNISFKYEIENVKVLKASKTAQMKKNHNTNYFTG